MTLTKIEAAIEIPEGFEFDRIDTKTKEGDYDFDGKVWAFHKMEFGSPRIILRKKSRPAYRVYRDTNNGCTYTRDAIDCPRDDHIPSPYYKWISDWIEYDPPKKWPTPLVERIAAIDIKAAEWIVDHWEDLLEEKYTLGSYNRMNTKLINMFYWDRSPQEHGYWDEISNKLGE